MARGAQCSGPPLPLFFSVPLYEYLNKAGKKTQRRVPVDQRDKQPGLTRIPISNVTFMTPGLVPETHVTGKKGVLKGYYDLECKHGSRFRSLKYTPEQIKRAWSSDNPPLANKPGT